MSHVAQIPPPTTKAADRSGPDRHWHPRFMPCAVCLRPASGFGFFNPHTLRPREHRWFCSMPCQGFFAMRFRKGMTMIGTTDEERLAIALVMKRLGQTMDQIGWNKRLCDLNETEVTALIEEVLEGYGAEMSRIARSEEAPF
ncbi:DUF6511 domain-containing protein [Loktanella sp. DJP18]|uniref:DUF6511 domain-containing protein n=1 Tax=Loktanella sp. DJP18 TaxID=3409788 RepID=UPI003BB74638